MYLRVTRGQGDPTRIDETIRLVPAISAAIRQLPGCQGVQIGIDRSTGKSVAFSTFDTLAHAPFPGEQLGESLTNLQAVGWQPEAPEIYEGIEEVPDTDGVMTTTGPEVGE